MGETTRTAGHERLPLLRALGMDPARASLVLRHCVCAACAFGSRGLWDVPGRSLHRCRDRRRVLVDAVRGPMDRRALPDPTATPRDRKALRALGRVPAPLLRRGGGGFRILGWDDALHLVRTRVEAAGAERVELFAGPEPLSAEAWWTLRRYAGAGFGLTVEEEDDRRILAALAQLPDRPTGLLADVERAATLLLALPEGGPSPLRSFVRSAERRGAVVPDRTGRADAVVFSADACARLPALAEAAGATASLIPVFTSPATASRWMLGPSEVRPAATDPEVALVLGSSSSPAIRGAGLRVHVAPFLEPEAIEEPAGELLVLPAATLWDAPGGTLRPGADGRVRFSPEVLGLPDFEARPAWWILDRLLPGADGPFADADALRRRLAAEPGWAGAADCNRPRACFHPEGPLP